MNAWFLFVAALGLVFGSFGNVLVYRIRQGMSLTGRSACPHCASIIHWYDLVPVCSFLVLGGRCRSCRAAISFQYPLVEIFSMMVFLFAMYLHLTDPLAGLLLGFSLYFLLLACAYDALYQELPDIFTLLIFLFAAAFHFSLHDALFPLILGAVIPAVWFGSQWLISQGRVVGSGDILLGAALGFLLGYPQIIAMLLLSYMVGALIVLLLLLLGVLSMKKNQKISFGPFLGIATLLTLAGAGEMYAQLLL